MEIIELIFVPLDSLLIGMLSLIYTILWAINVYDIRLIQIKTRGFHSYVALDAKGRMLPKWTGVLIWIKWVIFVILIVLNWKYTIALYILLFILRVSPVLEFIGALIMRPFLIKEEE